MSVRRRVSPLLILLAILLPGAAFAQAKASEPAAAEVQTSWRLLDYVAVDYPGAVAGGRVVSAAEYAEMREFSGSVSKRIGALPAKPERAGLLARAKDLEAAIGAKAPPARVADLARSLGSALIAAYPVPLAPTQAPDVAAAGNFYASVCAACHGANGDAKTPLAARMDPPPIAFTDRDRASQRSVFALYQVISQGLEGTDMASFANLPAEQRWALAFRVGSFAYPPELVEQGRRIWQADPALRASIPDLDALAAITPAALAGRIGPDKAVAVTAFLRANPSAVVAADAKGVALDVARSKLRESLAAYSAGRHKEAEELALSAYLDGFEPVEPMLAARDGTLMRAIEGAMGEVRSAIGRGAPAAEVGDRIAALDGLFAQAETALAPSASSSTSTFLGAFTILLREGLEALLIVVAMLAFLRKADRPVMVRTVHYGWVSALAAGIATWWIASNLISISGASRELTEGFGSLLAALVLLFVGIWMHGKAQADEWQRYIREKVGQALTRSSAWFLFSLAFIAVYREVFETILFFAALSAEGNGLALLAGAAAGTASLALVALLMLRFSRRLPIGKFFSYSSILIAILTVVLAGKGVAALQEAGLIGVTPARGVPTISWLGLFPTVEALSAQIVGLLALAAGFAWNKRERKPLEAVA